MPFSDPMADGPAIQAASQRALGAGMTLAGTLAMVRRFRHKDQETPLVLMGYFNPIYRFGAEAFAAAAAEAGVDGLIVVDLPPEESAELAGPARAYGIDMIALVAPTSDEARLETILAGASGFVYNIAVAGVTGGASATRDGVETALARLRRHTNLPVAVGFGIRTPEQAAEVARLADAVVVGSALVQRLADGLDAAGAARPGGTAGVLDLVRDLAAGVRRAREQEGPAS